MRCTNILLSAVEAQWAHRVASCWLLQSMVREQQHRATVYQQGKAVSIDSLMSCLAPMGLCTNTPVAGLPMHSHHIPIPTAQCLATPADPLHNTHFPGKHSNTLYYTKTSFQRSPPDTFPAKPALPTITPTQEPRQLVLGLKLPSDHDRSRCLEAPGLHQKLLAYRGYLALLVSCR